MSRETFTFHVVSLPHTQTTAEWSNCAFTQNVRGFIKMMKSLGNSVILYGSEEYDVPVDRFVSCISKDEQRDLIGVTGPDTVLNSRWGDFPEWRAFNTRAVEAIRSRRQPGDVICTIGGDSSDQIATSLPDMPVVEFAIGMSGIMFRENVYHIFGSYAWMHTLYGRYYGSHGTLGRAMDRVIPHYIDPEDFEYREARGDYFLFVGRLNEDKGVGIAIDTARETGRKLVVAGQGMSMPDDVVHRGRVGPRERRQLFAGAAAVFVPTQYLEPFGMVAIEALISGAPIITSDWGGLSEINVHGVTGFKCHTERDYLEAATHLDQIRPTACRERGMRYSMDNIRHEYDRYFRDLNEHLLKLKGG